MIRMRTTIIFALLLTITSNLFALPIDFGNMQTATTTYGVVAFESCPHYLAGYNNEVYFFVSDDYTGYPSKLLRYNPLNGLSNTMNHSVLAETTGQFRVLREINGLLYFSDTLGNVYSYDGSTITPASGTPFLANNYVTSIEEHNGLIYFGTSKSSIYRYDGNAYKEVYAIDNRVNIGDMASWEKDGYIYASVGPINTCCPPTGYTIRSISGDAGSWETIPDLSNIYITDILLPTESDIYASVIDSAYAYVSSVRKSSDGTSFDIISQSSGQYKLAWGALYHDEIAYFFLNDPDGGPGYTLIDENGSVSLVVYNQDLMLTHAIELNGEIYALASAITGNPSHTVPTDVYLITTAPEPATLLLLGLGGLGLLKRRG